MSILPIEIIEDILRRLPVKPLKRFRAVAKSWCSLIDGPDFIKSHLRHSLSSNRHRTLLLGGLALYSIDLDSLEKAVAVKPPFYYKSVDGVSNSCNGVVLVMSEPPVLWNPYSTDYKILPPNSIDTQTEPELYSRITYGFGYDSMHDDYKVVRIVEFRNESTHAWVRSEAMIYGLRSSRWREIDGFPYPLPFLRGNWSVHVGGALHTLVVGPDRARIMAFSVVSEEHREVAMPRGIRMDDADVSLDVMDGCLCVVCRQRSRVVVWVMREYGVRESWTKLLSMCPPAIEPCEFVKPLVCSGGGDKVLLSCDSKRLVWHDLEKKTGEVVCVEGMPFMFYAETCVESLVSLSGPCEVKKGGREKNKVKKIIGNKRDDFLSEGFKLVL